MIESNIQAKDPAETMLLFLIISQCHEASRENRKKNIPAYCKYRLSLLCKNKRDNQLAKQTVLNYIQCALFIQSPYE